MIAAVGAVLSGAWMRIAIIGGAVLAVLLVLFSARQAGRQAERVETMARNLENVNAQRKAAAAAPSDRAGVVDRLRNGKF
ncbi:MAG: hypothetical protein JKY47_01105 [Thalassospira sp.]|jgi:uncharacterized membrane protein|uniref:hypothetical protein n=1 Tax=Thalassospira sp. 11-3 TaxID=2135614 RepID=UPI000D90B2B4|nr:hypothetical protein [Thalassospira sp. 11-3]MBL4839410.1 hypothetical protein [Thalassospira sp.]PXX36296.1 hypothetical protein C7967_101689 [Thalassospira sp. 11-3]